MLIFVKMDLFSCAFHLEESIAKSRNIKRKENVDLSGQEPGQTAWMRWLALFFRYHRLHKVCSSSQRVNGGFTFTYIQQICSRQLWTHLGKNVENPHKRRYNYWKKLKTLWQKEKLLVLSNFFFCHNVFKSCLLQVNPLPDMIALDSSRYHQ